MLMRAKVDFHAVEEHQRPMDKRLENWARWSNGRPGASVSPMFRLYRSPATARGDCNTGGVAVDGIDAMRMGKGVAHLPEPHRIALAWAYIDRTAPRRACQALGVSMEGLALYVRDGRQMLINRNV